MEGIEIAETVDVIFPDGVGGGVQRIYSKSPGLVNQAFHNGTSRRVLDRGKRIKCLHLFVGEPNCQLQSGHAAEHTRVAMHRSAQPRPVRRANYCETAPMAIERSKLARAHLWLVIALAACRPLLDPTGNPRAVAMSVIFFGFLVTVYSAMYAFANMHKLDRERYEVIP